MESNQRISKEIGGRGRGRGREKEWVAEKDDHAEDILKMNRIEGLMPHEGYIEIMMDMMQKIRK